MSDICGNCGPKKFLGPRPGYPIEYMDSEGSRVVDFGDHNFEVHKKDGTVLVYTPSKYSPSFRGRP